MERVRMIRGPASYQKALLASIRRFGWAGLEARRFKCGHEKAPWNWYETVSKGRPVVLCKVCRKAAKNKYRT